MNTKKLTFHADPSHGWLEVDFADLEALHITAKVSRYSYHSGTRAYLEEDCDLSLFMQTAEKAGYQINFKEHNSNHDSIVRTYQRYTKGN
jgi:hypothetical protein